MVRTFYESQKSGLPFHKISTVSYLKTIQKLKNAPSKHTYTLHPRKKMQNRQYLVLDNLQSYRLGLLLVKYRRGTMKGYGCVFTCMSTRAVHIEVSSDLSTDSFVQAVCRFVSCRGPPKEIYSDNGTNFRGVEVEVKEALSRWNQDRVRERLHQQGIE